MLELTPMEHDTKPITQCVQHGKTNKTMCLTWEKMAFAFA
jgi:hypothetical protein